MLRFDMAANKIMSDRSQRRKMYSIVAIMGLVVAVSVFFLLSLPALTMDGALACELEEHVHGDECVDMVPVCGSDDEIAPAALECELEELSAHEHDDACYTAQIVCEITDDVHDEVIEPHDHSDECYEDDTLVCEADGDVAEMHDHSEECYGEVSLTCDTEHTQGHTHDETCYAFSAAEDEDEAQTDDHEHTDDCYRPTTICESQEHLHTEECYVSETAMLGISPSSGDGGIESSALVDFLTSFAIRDRDGNLVGNCEGETGTVYVGDTYKISLMFKENYGTPRKQFMYDEHGNLVYQLPESIKVRTEIVSMIFAAGTDNVIGEYTITTDGEVKVKFHGGLKPDGTQDASNNNYIDYLDVSFWVDLDAELTSDGGGEELLIDFGGDTKITVEITERVGDIDVTKTFTTLNYLEHTVAFTVTIKAVGGTVDSITLTDVISFKPLDKTLPVTHRFTPQYHSDIIQIDRLDSNGVQSSGYPKAVLIRPVFSEINKTTGEFTVTFADGDGNPINLTLLEGETVSLVYNLKIDDSNFQTTQDDFVVDGYKGEASVIFSGDIINKVTANGRSNGDDVSDSAEATTRKIIYPLIKEDGLPTRTNELSLAPYGGSVSVSSAELVTLYGENLVKWTVRAGDGYFNVSDWVLSDNLDSSMKYVSDIPILMTSAEKLTNGNLSNTKTTVVVSWDNSMITEKTDNSFKLKIPTSEKPLVYDFVYYTTMPTNFDGAKDYTNTALLSKDGTAKDQAHDSGKVIGEAINLVRNFTKDGVYRMDRDTLVLDYTVSIIIPKEAYGKQLYFVDYSTVSVNVNGKDDLSARPTQNIYELNFKLETLDGDEIDQSVYKPYTYIDASNRHFFFGYDKSYKVTNLNDAKNGSAWNVDQDSILTITYKYSLDAYLEKYDMTIQEALDGGHVSKLNNSITLHLNKKNQTVWNGVFPFVRKSAHLAYWAETSPGVFQWVVQGGGNISSANIFTREAFDAAEIKGIYYKINVTAGELGDGDGEVTGITVTDVYDEKLVYSPNSMRIRRELSGTYTRFYPGGSVTAPNDEWAPSQSENGWHNPLANTTEHSVFSGNNTFTLDFGKINRRYSGTTAGSRKTIALDDPNDKLFGNPKTVLELSYVMTFPNGEIPAGFNTYSNTATVDITIDGETYVQSSETDTSFGKEVVDKKMPITGKTASVTIEINPDGTLLNPDGKRGELIKVEDVMTNLSLYSSTLEVRINGKTEPEELHYGATDTLFGYISETTADGENLTLWLPDETPIVITYKALVQGKDGETVDVVNAVSIYGTTFADVEEKFEYTVSNSQGGGAASTGSLRITKHDSIDTLKLLPGAEFELYASNTAVAGVDSTKTIPVGDATYYFYKTVTVADGSIVLNDNEMLPGTTWALVETRAPEGYILDSKTIVFGFSGDDGVPDGVKEISDKIDIPNTAFHVELPSTGGDGTTIYTISGLALMLAGVAVTLVRTRKKNRVA